MLRSCAQKPAQDGLRLGSAQTHSCRVLDHQIIVLFDDLPVDWACQHWLEMRVGIGFPSFRAIEFLSADILEPWHELETQKMAESKGNFVLSMRIYKLLFDLHLGTMPQDACDHCRNLRRGTGFELRVNTGGMLFNMPVQHHAFAPVT